MLCWVLLLVYLTLSFLFYIVFYFFWRHSGWLYAQARKSTRVFILLFFGLYCKDSCFRASDSLCLWLLDILRTHALNLCCVFVPLSVFFFSFLIFLKLILSLSYQPGVGTTALLVTTVV